MSSLPALCAKCGFKFRSGFSLDGTRNSVAYNNLQSCPRCGQVANVADASTDSQGRLFIREFFQYFQQLDKEQLLDLRQQLSPKEPISSGKELSRKLEAIDSSNSRFRYLLSKVPAKFAVTTILALITLLLTCYGIQVADENHDESISLEREKFEYQKQRDDREEQSQDQLDQAIEKLRTEFEERFEATSDAAIQKEAPIAKQQGRIKGYQRNKPCPCGSGRKSKYCHPNGLLNE